MTESYNTTYMQRHLIDCGTTVPASLRVFTPDALFQAQFKFTSGSARPDLTFNGSPLMEGRQMNDARFSVRAQAPAAVQFLFDSSSVFCVGGDLSTSLSALSIFSSAFASPNAGMISLPAARIAGHPDYAPLSSSLPLIRIPGHDGMHICASAKHGTAFAEGFAFFFSVPGSPCDAGWRFLPNSAAALTVSTPWFLAHARYTVYYDSAPCRRDTRRFCRGGFALQVGRTLRL